MNAYDRIVNQKMINQNYKTTFDILMRISMKYIRIDLWPIRMYEAIHVLPSDPPTGQLI
jgi:hypothetical protein